jgi:hypothetical protein
MREDIPLSMHLAVTLRFLATGDSYRTLSCICVSSTDYHTKVCRTITSLTGYVNARKCVKVYHMYTSCSSCTFRSLIRSFSGRCTTKDRYIEI